LRYRLVIIHAEQDESYLKQRLREGRSKPLKPAPPFDGAVIDRAQRIVGMEVKFFVCDNALAFKASIPRPNFQGDPRDSDHHGGQQSAPLMDIEIPGV
jgi:hypothetical protein